MFFNCFGQLLKLSGKFGGLFNFHVYLHQIFQGTKFFTFAGGKFYFAFHDTFHQIASSSERMASRKSSLTEAYLFSFMILSTLFFTEEGMDIVIIFLILPLYYIVIQTSRKKRLIPYATGRN